MDAEDRVNILLVDDKPENLLALIVTLERLGENLVTATSGKEALKRLLEEDYAVILLDVQMPEMDGFETASLIRQRDRSRHTPIIFITAISKTENHVFRGYSLGAVDYIFKPIEPEVLRSKVTVFADLFRKTQYAKRLNETLKRRTVELETANEELQAFSYSISHDLRIPLRAINGFAQILDRRHRQHLDEEGQHYLGNIVKAGEQMEQQIDDLLAYARLGRESLRYQPLALRDVVTRVVENLAGRLEEENGEVAIADDLPEVVGCRRLLERVLSNLIDNAITFHRPDVPPRVEISAQLQADSYTIQVRDNGIGITSEDQAKVFLPYGRLRGPVEHTGTGIGLALVKKSVDLMGGWVWVESKPDEGSSFWVKLPNIKATWAPRDDWNEPVVDAGLREKNPVIHTQPMQEQP